MMMMQTIRMTVNFPYSFLPGNVGSRVFRNVDKYTLNYDMIYIVKCSWVDTRWQWYSTNLQTVHRTTRWNRIPRTEHTWQ